MDDDCNGFVDENLVRECGSNVGECSMGLMVCSEGDWGTCVGGTGPIEEICQNGLDDDCDTETDEGEGCRSLNASICTEGEIPYEGCLCAGEPRNGGYCLKGIYYDKRPGEFPWVVVSIFGIIIMLAVLMGMIYH
jgi:hypothetical protein